MATPRKRSKKETKVISAVDEAYLTSIEEMRLFGEDTYGDGVLHLYDYQYRLDMREEFPACSVVDVLEYYGGFATVGPNEGIRLTSFGADGSFYKDELALFAAPYLVYVRALDLITFGKHGEWLPRNLVITIADLYCPAAQLEQLEQLFAEPQELPVTYCYKTRSLLNYNPQPSKNK